MRSILTNGKIYVEKGDFKEALLIEDGMIVEVGLAQDFMSTPSDRVIDLEGRTVLPGLNDSHLHIASVGSAMNSCNLNPARSIDDIVRIGQEFLQNNPELPALNGRGWNQDYFVSGEKRMLTRADLDRISTSIPIVFTRVCGHMATGNTKAIEMLSVDENTYVDGGVIELDEGRKPNGVFCENAISLLNTVIPAKTDEDIEAEILKASEYAISVGLTSVQSCDISKEDQARMFGIFHRIYNENKTKLRYSHQFNFQDIIDFQDYLDTEFKSTDYDDRFLSKGALKLFVDGSLGARTALMLKEYDDEEGTLGVQVLSDEDLYDICELASRNGITVVTHAIGDGAIDVIIDAYEKTMKDGENPLRHGIVHCQITSKEQLERIANLNIAVMYQPIFLDYDMNIVESRVGEELASTSYAFNSLYKLGANISFGTDSPVEDLNPWNNLHCAVTRTGLDGEPEGGFYPEEKMDISDAIDCYTYGSAYNEFKEDFKGRLKAGFAADLIVLDRDIFSIDPSEIKEVQVQKTMINGEFVFER
ncbi:MAG: amidohydrolase family protein [Gudongella sp.]|nr:amidohydrolase family protein [Gudongella sp.]